MLFALFDLVSVVALVLVMLGVQKWGCRIGKKEKQLQQGSDDKSSGGAAEGAVYAILGLLVAFTFSGAGSRLEHRYALGVQEANAIGTAWLRLDVLPEASQPHLRDLFREYVDARIQAVRLAHRASGDAAESRSTALQQEIWSAVTDALAASGQTPLYGVVVGPINEMIDITTTRAAARLLHPPMAVYAMLGIFALVGSLFSGYAMAEKPRSWIHSLGFPVVIAIALFVTVDFEFPRFGFIHLGAVDALLVDLRTSMDKPN